MISHDACRDQLGEYLDQTLDPHRRERVEAHLESCADCARIAGEMAGIRATLREMAPFAAPPRFRHNVRAALQNERQKQSQRPVFAWRLPQIAWSGSLAVGAFVLIVLTRPFANAPLLAPEQSQAPDAVSSPATGFAPPNAEIETGPAAKPLPSRPTSPVSRQKATPAASQTPKTAPQPRREKGLPEARQPEPGAATLAPQPALQKSRVDAPRPRDERPIAASPLQKRFSTPAPALPQILTGTGRAAKRSVGNETGVFVAPSPAAAASAAPPRESARAQQPVAAPSPGAIAVPSAPRAEGAAKADVAASAEGERRADFADTIRQQAPIASEIGPATPLFSLQLKSVPAPASAPKVVEPSAPATKNAAPQRAHSGAASGAGGRGGGFGMRAPAAETAPPLSAMAGSMSARALPAPANVSPIVPNEVGAAISGGVRRFELQFKVARPVKNARVRLQLPPSLRLLWPLSSLVWSGDLSPENRLEIAFSLGSVRGGEEISVVVEQKVAGGPSRILETQNLLLPPAP